jgi:hypothetical protein
MGRLPLPVPFQRDLTRQDAAGGPWPSRRGKLPECAADVGGGGSGQRGSRGVPAAAGGDGGDVASSSAAAMLPVASSSLAPVAVTVLVSSAALSSLAPAPPRTLTPPPRLPSAAAAAATSSLGNASSNPSNQSASCVPEAAAADFPGLAILATVLGGSFGSFAKLVSSLKYSMSRSFMSPLRISLRCVMLAFPNIECSVSKFVDHGIIKQQRNGANTCCAQNKLGKGHLVNAMTIDCCRKRARSVSAKLL